MDLSLSSVFIKKNPIQVGFLKEFLQKEVFNKIKTFNNSIFVDFTEMGSFWGTRKGTLTMDTFANFIIDLTVFISPNHLTVLLHLL